ncbi:MAG: hypothetical protein HYZ29_21910 [Myxococcales bacterium]|nr:hypothetical protein [Myxococcales bacterium]
MNFARSFPASVALLLVLVACERKATPIEPAAPPPSAPAAAPSLERTASAAPAPSPSAPKGEANCYPAAKSRDIGSTATAAPPFADCANHLKVHCGGKDGERGGLTGLALDLKATAAARKRQPDACCYASCE